MKHFSKTITTLGIIFLFAGASIQPLHANESTSLTATCSPSEESVMVGENVTWTADAEGGTGNYTYLWTDGSSDDTLTESFIAPGNKTQTLVVTDNNSFSTAVNCSVTVTNSQNTGGNGTAATNNLDAQCRVSDTTVFEGDVVEFEADVTGGSGTYDYDWDWDIDGSNEIERIRFNQNGNYEVRLTIRDDVGNMDVALCPTVVVREENSNNSSTNNSDELDLRCRVSDTRVREGDIVEYEVEIDGGNSPYNIEWLGDIDGDDETERVRYERDGRMEVDVEVIDDDGERERISCPDVRVDEYNYSNTGINSSSNTGTSVFTNNGISGRGNSGNFASSGNLFSLFGNNTSNTNQIQTYNGGNGRNTIAGASFGTNAGVNSVLLSQVPYTGPADVLKVLGVLALLAGISLAGAYHLRKQRGTIVVSNKIENFKNRNKSAIQIS